MKTSSIVKAFALFPLLFFVLNATAQSSTQDPTLFSYGGIPVAKSEFKYVYEKLNGQDPDLYSKKSVDDYLELYINFKLKVQEAEKEGLDTLSDLKMQLDQYRKQLAQSYLFDKQITEQLLREAYTRIGKEVRARHILIACGEDAAAKDTLDAFNRAMDVYNKLTKEKLDFATIAKQYSQDPSVKDNEGDLGYFTAFQMVYPFESAAYNTPKGSISKPVRTKFGYHIVKKDDERPARGKVQVAHIFLSARATDTKEKQDAAKAKIDELYAKLLKKEIDFESTAKTESQDKESMKDGGKLPWFGVGKMQSAFEEAAFALKTKGEMSKPLQTPIGWHILKLLDRKEVGTFESMKDELKKKIEKDSRSRVSKTLFIKRLKKDYQLKEEADAANVFKKMVNSDVLKGRWKASSIDKNANAPVFTLMLPAKKTYTQQDFAAFIEAHQGKVRAQDSATAVDRLYEMFVERSLLESEESQLEKKQPEFAKLMKEFRDGNLLYELMSRRVWNKAMQDSAGLAAHYEQHRDKYHWSERVDVSLFTCNDDATAAQYRAIADTADMARLERDIKESGKTQNLKIESRVYERGQNDAIDQMEWKTGLSKNVKTKDGKTAFAKIKQVLPPAPKKLEEARGYVIADYQAQLEKEWLKELRTKYAIKVEDMVLKSLYKTKTK